MLIAKQMPMNTHNQNFIILLSSLSKEYYSKMKHSSWIKSLPLLDTNFYRKTQTEYQ